MPISRKNIILGSQSPRRRELMAGLDLPFTAVNIDADESYPAELQAGDIPYFISRAKARAYESRLEQDELLLTADTIGGRSVCYAPGTERQDASGLYGSHFRRKRLFAIGFIDHC